MSFLSTGFPLVQEGTENAPSGGPFSFMFPMLVIVAIFYFVLIAPERKKQKRRDAMLAGMGKGNKVMTTSGIYGTVVQIQDDVVTLQVADNVRLRFSRAAVQKLLGEDGKTEKEPEKS